MIILWKINKEVTSKYFMYSVHNNRMKFEKGILWKIEGMK